MASAGGWGGSPWSQRRWTIPSHLTRPLYPSFLYKISALSVPPTTISHPLFLSLCSGLMYTCVIFQGVTTSPDDPHLPPVCFVLSTSHVCMHTSRACTYHIHAHTYIYMHHTHNIYTHHTHIHTTHTTHTTYIYMEHTPCTPTPQAHTHTHTHFLQEPPSPPPRGLNGALLVHLFWAWFCSFFLSGGFWRALLLGTQCGFDAVEGDRRAGGPSWEGSYRGVRAKASRQKSPTRG